MDWRDGGWWIEGPPLPSVPPSVALPVVQCVAPPQSAASGYGMARRFGCRLDRGSRALVIGDGGHVAVHE